jgi:hypothetical protein
MSAKKRSATLHRRGGITMNVEVPDPVPEAIARPSEVSPEGQPPGTPSGEFGERLFRLRSSGDGTLHYIQDHYLPEPSEGATTDGPARCSACGRARSMFFIRALPRTENLSAKTARLCDECYPDGSPRAGGREKQSPGPH